MTMLMLVMMARILPGAHMSYFKCGSLHILLSALACIILSLET